MGENKGKKSATNLKREFSAGGVVYKRSLALRAKKLQAQNSKTRTLWLIIKPGATDRWQLPKGTIDEGESSEVTAVREVEEEGGIKAKIVQKIGNQQYFFFWQKERIMKTVTFYLMEYLSDTKEGHDHEVDKAIFISYEEAYTRLTFKNDKDMLDKAKETLERGVQENLI